MVSIIRVWSHLLEIRTLLSFILFSNQVLFYQISNDFFVFTERTERF